MLVPGLASKCRASLGRSQIGVLWLWSLNRDSGAARGRALQGTCAVLPRPLQPFRNTPTSQHLPPRDEEMKQRWGGTLGLIFEESPQLLLRKLELQSQSTHIAYRV